MEIGIIGLPQSGKTTLFAALLGESAPKATAGRPGPQVGVVKVPDARLQVLEAMFHPKRTVFAEIRFWDVAERTFTKDEGIGSQIVNTLRQADALLHVVRVFGNESVPHSEGSVDPERDVATVNLELAFSDLALLETRLQRLDASLRGAKGLERESYLREHALLGRIKEQLERDIPIREQSLTQEEWRAIDMYRFLTAKPLMVVYNLGEEQRGEIEVWEKQADGQRARLLALALCAKLEAELAQMQADEAAQFRAALGWHEVGRGRIIRGAYELLGYISFLTVGPDEVRAWSIVSGTTAQAAAGKIHSDMEKGFIRAEVVSFAHLTQCGSLAETRKRGLMRLEGKNYPVLDGDVITFLFNV
ncbi:MAG: redox-regulated ATPase YchF [Chloroflexi bacterium]|nr:redox-regulated ATPase YchF [Chloroflexota bacterium]